MCRYLDRGICNKKDCEIVENEGNLLSCPEGKAFRQQERVLEQWLSKTEFSTFNFLNYYRNHCSECPKCTRIGICENNLDVDFKFAILACHTDHLLEQNEELLAKIKDSITEFRLLCAVKDRKK